MGEAWNKGSDTLKNRLNTKENGQVLRKRNAVLKAQIIKATKDGNEPRQKFLDKALEINELKLKAHNKKTHAESKERKAHQYSYTWNVS